MNTIILLNTA